MKVRCSIDVIGDLEGTINSIGCSQNGNYIFCGMSDGPKCILVFSSLTGRLVKSLADQEQVFSLAISADGSKVYGGVNNGVAVWNFNTGALEKVLDGHKRKTLVALSPDGKYLISGDQNAENDCNLKIWECATLKNVHTSYKLSKIKSICISADSKYYYLQSESLSEPTYMMGYKMNGESLAPTKVSGRLTQVFAIGKTIGFGVTTDDTPDAFAHVYVLADGHVEGESTAAMFPVETKTISQLTSNPDGNQFAVASGDNAVRIYSNTGKSLIQVAEHKSEVSCMQFGPDGTFFVTASIKTETEPSCLKIWY